ncbi:glycosyltransferase [Aquamicrobium defluvii]|uniref:Glycosyltransferase involved in cell wall biosynthesis n=1 Tax=Aquamicrobium defluvii TaxID=69279 RepID=A0A4R6YF15_9HYPH|nr:glycosyltransferase [Aquamicrobium defluvii]TDR34867.1 glycosyltransferase involved in cell wall biosynthesis [Aquamicrobium defluvii]
MTGPRILIVTYNWPPRNAIGTHRPYAWAKYWSNAGAQVTVLTAAKRIFDAPLDLHLPDLNGVRVIEVPYGGAGLSLLDQLVRNLKVRSYLKRVRSYLRRSSSSAPADPRSGWRGAAIPLIAELAKDNDFVVSTYGPDASHLIANDAKSANPDIIWVADYRDLWSQNPMAGWSDGVRASIRSLEEGSVGRNADLVTAVSEDMIRQLGEFCKGRLLLAPNGFDLDMEDLEQVFASPSRHCANPLRIVHTGTVYPPHGPTPLLEVLAGMADKGDLELGEVTVDFYGSRVELIVQLMCNPRFRPFLRTPGHVAREDAIEIQREADLLLLLASSAPEGRGVLTGKVFEYISAGRPIICVGSRPDFEIGQLLRRTGTGIVFDYNEPACIAQVIRAQLDGKGSPEWFAPKLEEIGRYTRKKQALALLAELTDDRSR